jgi:hypothetical protein
MGAAAADAKKMAKAVERILMSGRSSEKERIRNSRECDWQ